MEMTAGTRLGCTACETEVVVVAAPTESVVLSCGGVELVDASAERGTASHESGEGALLGKRYVDEDTSMELLCVKPGTAPLAADGRPLEVKGAKPLPASD